MVEIFKQTKRLIDIVLSILALLLLFTPMTLIAVLIKLESKGPIIFKQKRPGKNKELFNIYKFRTMKISTPNLSTEDLGDPSTYVTKLGRFLRKTSLDELPQLVNILVGHMSIVGPRPALYNQYDLIAMRDEVDVNSISPGLTGYAQVKGRDYISDKEKVSYDQYYLENMDLWLDIKVIWLTFWNVVRLKGVRIT